MTYCDIVVQAFFGSGEIRLIGMHGKPMSQMMIQNICILDAGSIECYVEGDA